MNPPTGGPRVRWPAASAAGQSLPGLAVATAGANGHGNVDNIRSFAGIRGGTTLGQAARDPEVRGALAHVLRQPQEVVDARAHQLVAPIGAMEAIDFFGARVPASDVLLGRRRVGDTSGSGHHMAIWQFIHLPVDRTDGTVVVDRCQSCGAPLDWKRIDREGMCGARDAEGGDRRRDQSQSGYDCRAPGAGANDRPERIGPERLERTLLLADLIDPDPSVHAPRVQRLAPDLRGEDRGTVFYLGLKLGRAIAFSDGGSRLRRGSAAPLEEALTTLEIGSAIIAGWPDSVSRLIVETATVDRDKALAAIANVRRVCHGEGHWPEHRDLIRDALPDIMTGRHQHAIRRLMPDTVDGGGARGIIGIRSHDMAKLIRARKLEPVVTSGRTRTHGTFTRSSAQAIGDALAGSIAATSIVEELGMTLHGVEQLVCEGHLTREGSEAVAVLRPGLQIVRSSYDTFRATLVNDDTPRTIEDGIPLRHALLHVGGREKPWAAILAAMLSGDLAYAVTAPAGRLVDRISVSRGESLAGALSATFSRSDHDGFPFASTMRQRDAIELLNIDPSRFQRIAGLMPADAHGPGKTLAVAGVVDLAARIIDQREARARWGRSLDRSLMIDGGIGWWREEVEQARGAGLAASQRSFAF